MTTALATTNGQTALAAAAQRAVAGGRFQGAQGDDLILPRVQVFQGTPEERAKFGKHLEDGKLFNTLTLAHVASAQFVPLTGWKEWIKFREPRGSGIEYRTREFAQVPPADAAWAGEGKDRKPPAATETINWVVVFVGEDHPVVISFKRTSINAGKTLISSEHIYRGAKGPGLYALDIAQKSGPKGSFYVPKIRPCGDPEPELAAKAQSLIDSLAGRNVDVDLEGSDLDEVPPQI